MMHSLLYLGNNSSEKVELPHKRRREGKNIEEQTEQKKSYTP